MKAVNGGYRQNNVWFIDGDGNISEYDFGDLEFPYFYSPNKIEYSGIVNVLKEKIKVLYKNGVKEMEVYKYSVASPYIVKAIKEANLENIYIEANIVYLERRLGADGIVEWVKPCRYAYVDIEADKEKITLIGLIVMNDGKAEDYIYFNTAEEFIDYIEERKIIMLLAWNGKAYDFAVLDKYLNKYEYWKYILKVDAMDLYSYFTRSISRSLDFVGREEGLGGKLDIKIAGLVEYNKRDVELMRDIIENNNLVESFFEIANITGIKPDLNNYRETWIVENYIMKNRELFDNIYLLDKATYETAEEYAGAYIFIKEAGIFENVAVYDINSLYPSVFLYEDLNNECCEYIYKFWRKLIRIFWEYKEKYRNIDKIKYNIYKVFVNGSYGVFGTPFFRYYDKTIAEFITSKGRETLMKMRTVLEKAGYNVIYSDTDSAFAIVGNRENAESILKYLNKSIFPYEAKIDKYFVRVFFTEDESGKAIKKRYAGLTDDGKIIVVGFEAVRKDWCFLARDTQYKLIEIGLTSANKREAYAKMKEYIRAVRTKLFTGQVSLDDLAIVKSFDVEKQYKVKTQTLKAIEQMNANDSELRIQFVEYFFGRGGKILVRNMDENKLRGLIDYNLYWEKQIKPSANRIMAVFEEKMTLDDFSSAEKDVYTHVNGGRIDVLSKNE